MVFPIPLSQRILLNEVDINILGILDLNYVGDICRSKGYDFDETREHLPRLTKGSATHTFHVRFINDMIINFVPVVEEVNTIQLFEALEESNGKLTDEEQEYINNRPSTKEEFAEYLINNYVLARQDENGQIIEAMTMNGQNIFSLK